MNLGNIAINNLMRRKSRILFILAGMVIGITTITALFSVTDAMKIDLGDKFDQIGANIVITPKSKDLSLSYGGMTVSSVSAQEKPLDENVPSRILQIPNKDKISVIAPKLITETPVEGKRSLVVGVNFIPELTLKSWWNIRTVEKPAGTNPPLEEKVLVKKSLPKLTENEVILGSLAAEKLAKQPGDTLVIQGQQFKVWGVIDPVGSTVDDSIHMDLKKTQSLFNLKGQLSFIEVAALCTNCPIEDMIIQLEAALPEAESVAVREAVKTREDTVDKFTSFAKGMSIIVLAIGSFVVFLTMLSSINERTREIGILRAIGFRSSHITTIILIEAMIISSLAGIIGFVSGMVMAELVGPLIAQMDINIIWSMEYGVQAFLIAIVLGVVASVIPAIKAANMDPNESLRFM